MLLFLASWVCVGVLAWASPVDLCAQITDQYPEPCCTTGPNWPWQLLLSTCRALKLLPLHKLLYYMTRPVKTHHAMWTTRHAGRRHSFSSILEQQERIINTVLLSTVFTVFIMSSALRVDQIQVIQVINVLHLKVRHNSRELTLGG